MGRIDRISKLKSNVKVLNIKNSDRLVIFSDCHRGDGSFKDALYPNVNIYLTALRYYYNENFTYIEDGDGDELWKFKNINDIYFAHTDEYKIFNQFKQDNRFYMIYGNHDDEKAKKKFKNNIQKSKNELLKDFYLDLEIHEGLLLKFSESKDVLVFHGHQLDYISSEFAFASKFLVRYIWSFLNGVLSFKEILSPAKCDNVRESVDNRVYKWCKENNESVIIGHTHNTIFPDKNEIQYFNCGCCVLPYTVTCIEIKNGTIALVKWVIKSTKDGVLAVKKELISSPRFV
ncbi:metallophosphoesterase family protein [uncultured Clostridium sp.]|uniref:metallophosphoesterase family protein n=1 Tax=uncultured Clostridium sp. TaxID=59620 RepID=UPI0026302A91|nr:metallophosphoesterase [uncultured Clostridium sp.]